MLTLPGAASLHLVDDWHAVLARAWSIRLIIAAGLLDAASTILSLYSTHPPIPLGLFAALSGLVNAAAIVARLVAQRNLGAS